MGISVKLPFAVVLDFSPLFRIKKFRANGGTENIKQNCFLHVNVFTPRFFPQETFLSVSEGSVCELINLMDEREVRPEIDQRSLTRLAVHLLDLSLVTFDQLDVIDSTGIFQVFVENLGSKNFNIRMFSTCVFAQMLLVEGFEMVYCLLVTELSHCPHYGVID